jgi:hypothetical protein
MIAITNRRRPQHFSQRLFMQTRRLGGPLVPRIRYLSPLQLLQLTLQQLRYPLNTPTRKTLASVPCTYSRMRARRFSTSMRINLGRASLRMFLRSNSRQRSFTGRGTLHLTRDCLTG